MLFFKEREINIFVLDDIKHLDSELLTTNTLMNARVERVLTHFIKEEKLDKIIDFISKNKYNIEEELSLYAFEQKDDISELLAEAYTRKKLGKTNSLVKYILDLYGLGE